MNTGFICKNTNTVARLVVRVVGKPRCFVKYVDAEGEIAFPGNVGKCDHENSCGYHYTPKEYFKHHSVRLQSLSSRHCSCKHGTALDSAVYFKDNPDVLTRDQSVGESFQLLYVSSLRRNQFS